MSFVKLEERENRHTQEYYLRTDLIRQVDVEKDEQGRVVRLFVVICDLDTDGTGRSELEFTGEDAEKNYSNLSSFLLSS